VMVSEFTAVFCIVSSTVWFGCEAIAACTYDSYLHSRGNLPSVITDSKKEKEREKGGHEDCGHGKPRMEEKEKRLGLEVRKTMYKKSQDNDEEK